MRSSAGAPLGLLKMPNRLTGQLTAREHEIASLVARGLCNKLIARELHMSVAMVKLHLHRTYIKLNVSGRTQLAVLVATDPLRAV
jgi:two-component system nitrate/nitrite response regulator NarL